MPCRAYAYILMNKKAGSLNNMILFSQLTNFWLILDFKQYWPPIM